MNEILVYFSIKYGGDWDQIYAAINRKEKVDRELMEELLSKQKNNYITILDSNYPSKLKSIYKPPFVLFYKGDISLVNTNNKMLAIIGSRKNTLYGKHVTEQLTKDIVKENIIVISGLAKGIDSIAHKTTLIENGKTIGVLGNGINIKYPLDNSSLQEEISNKGLIVSEYPDFIEAKKEHFPKRNRIIAGLCDAVLVTEANCKSGSMITVSRALELGKDIFCVPHVIGCASGCNMLIKEGAKLVESAQDILLDI